MPPLSTITIVALGIALLATVFSLVYLSRQVAGGRLVKLRAERSLRRLQEAGPSMLAQLKREFDTMDRLIKDMAEYQLAGSVRVPVEARIVYEDLDFLVDAIELTMDISTARPEVQALFNRAQVRLGIMSLALGNYADAIRRLKKANTLGDQYLMSIGEDPARIPFALGNAYMLWGAEEQIAEMITKGIGYLEQANLRASGKDRSILFNLAWAYDERARITGNQGFFDEAIRYNKLAIEASGGMFPEAAYNLACALARKGELANALEMLKEIPGGHAVWQYIEVDNDFAEVRSDPRFRALVEERSKDAAARVTA